MKLGIAANHIAKPRIGMVGDAQNDLGDRACVRVALGAAFHKLRKTLLCSFLGELGSSAPLTRVTLRLQMSGRDCGTLL